MKKNAQLAAARVDLPTMRFYLSHLTGLLLLSACGCTTIVTGGGGGGGNDGDPTDGTGGSPNATVSTSGGGGASGSVTSSTTTSTSTSATNTSSQANSSSISTGGVYCDTNQDCGECELCAIENLCQSEYAACVNSRDCLGFDACLGTCSSSLCVDGCINANPIGHQIWITAVNCIDCESCPNACGEFCS